MHNQILENPTPQTNCPKWIIVLIKIWAGTSVVLLGFAWLQVLLASSQDLSEVSFIYVLANSGWLILLFALAPLPELYVNIALFRLHRWVVPYVLIRSILMVVAIVGAAYFFVVPYELIYILYSIVWLCIAGLAYFARESLVTHPVSLMVRIFRGIMIFFYLMVVLPGFIYVVASFAFPDLSTTNDEDLILEPVNLPSGVNAYEVLVFPEEEDEEVVDFVISWRADFLIGSTTPTSSLSTMLNLTAPYTESLRQASQADYYACPTTLNNFTMEAKICRLTDIRNTSMVLLAEGLYQASTGGVDEAVNDTITVLQFAQMMHDGPPGPIVESLVGVAIKKHSLEQLSYLLDSYIVSTTSLQQIIASLPAYQNEEDAMIKTFKFEHTSMINTIEPILTATGKPTYWVQPMRTRAAFANQWREITSYYTEDTCESYSARAMQLGKELEERKMRALSWRTPFLRNALGEILFTTAAASLSSLREDTCELDSLSKDVQEKAEEKLREAEAKATTLDLNQEVEIDF